MLYSYLFLFFQFILITNCQVINNEKSKLASYVLNDFYQRQNSLLDFKNVQILNIYKQEDLLFGQVIVEASAESIGTARIYCEVVAFDNGSHLSQPPGDDPSQCVMQEFPSPLPSTEPGPDDLRTVDVSDPSVDDVLTKALEHAPELNQLRLVRVKAARIQGSSGTWFIRADMLRMLEEGSTMQYCAIELTPQEESVVSSLRISSINCQLGNGGLISTRSFNQVARRAVEHINSISLSRFKQNLVKILDAVESRNGGPLNDQYTLKLLMTPSVCQKREKNDDEINNVWEEHRSCIDDPASEKEQRYICELTVWFGSSHAENPLFSPSKCKHTPFDKKQIKTTDHGRTYSGTTTETISTTTTEIPQGIETELALEDFNNKGYPKSSEEFLDPIITSQSLSEPKTDDSLKENLKIISEEENFKKEENVDESSEDKDFTTTTTEEPLMSDDLLKENLKTISSEEENLKKEEILSESKVKESSEDKDYYTITTTEETLKSDHIPSVEAQVEIFEEVITPKQIYCTGCLHEINVERADLKNLTILALDHMNQNQKNKYSLVQIKNAQMQVTNGINYFLTYELSVMSSCLPLEENCQNVEQPSHIICSVELHEKPWIETSLVVLHSNCTKDSDNNLENEIVPSLPNEEIELKRLSTFENLFKPDVSKESHEKDPMAEFYSFPDDGLEDDLLPQPSQPIIDMTQSSRRKREIQVLKDMTDNEKELIEELAQISVRTMDDLDPDDNRRVVLDILEAKKQIVNGMLYHLKLRVGLTSCSESKEIEDKAKCLEEDHFSKICSVQLHRAFIDDEPNKVRVVELICSDENSKENQFKKINNSNRKKREAQIKGSKRLKRKSKFTSPILVGGYQPTDINDPMITSSASFALSELDRQSNNEEKHVLVKIINAATQIVSGINTRLTFELGLSNCSKSSSPEDVCSIIDNSKIKVCSVTVYSQPWTKTRRIENTYCKEKIQEEDSDSNSDKDKLVKHALGEVNKRSNSLYGQKLVQIHNYRRKMDDKNISYLSLELGYTNCRKHNDMNFDTCEIKSDSNNQLCYFKLYNPPNSDKIEINKMICNPINNPRVKRKVLGGEEATDINDNYIQKMAKFSLSELDKQSNDAYQKHLVRIIEAKKQVVQGNLIKLKFEIGLSNCLKREKNKENCQLQDNHATEICTVKIWDRPWLNKTEITELKCTSNQLRKKRQADREKLLVGGISQANPSDPFVQEMVQHSLKELDRASNDEYHKQLVEIIEASTQVVAGSLTRLKIKISSSDCLKSSRKEDKTNCKLQKGQPIELCTMKVWDRPWLNSTEVQDIKCNTITQRKKREDPDAHKKNALVGGLNVAKISDPYIKNLTKLSLDKLDETSNEIYHKHLIRIIEANKQLVAGNLVKLKLEVGLSDCLKNSQKENKQDCKLQENEKEEICVVDIWDRPWLKETEIRNMECTEKSQKLKREVNFNKKSQHEYKFRNFLIKHNKSYKTKEEFKRRFRIFRANLKKIDYLQETEQGTAIYGPTRFADLTTGEFKSKYLGLNPSLKNENTKPLQQAEILDGVIPKEFDWRHFNVVTPVKNQGACGSCWAFSVTGNIEGAWAIKKGQLLSLSEQELVDCDKLDDGCEGGLPTNAYTAIEQLGGLETESDYPYDGQDEKCSIDQSELRVQISGAVNISSNETKMAQWLVTNGPISIGINANAMQFYMGGVSHPLKFLCDPTNLDHGVLIVGYGVHKYPLFQKVLPFWVIKNSWGENWGEQGYYRVYRGDGTCGVNQMASSAIVN